MTPLASDAATNDTAGRLRALMQESVVRQEGTGAAGPPSEAAADSRDGLGATGNLPLKPSLGAIQGAFGTTLPAARLCLGPDDPISRATVTFKSDGTVENVSLTGGAAGKPAEACIRAALMKAQVPPFSQPIFTAPATVRPN